VDEAGELVVLDQDDLGPADPARELARALFDWWSDPDPDLTMMRTSFGAYVRAGGPARIGHLPDFTMLVSARLNFLVRQLHVASSESSQPEDVAWAGAEIDESLRILPTVDQLSDVVEVLGAISGR
jgi:hypothetical protein